jgi:formylglycine-generating enzyme required for sulfatase activity
VSGPADLEHLNTSEWRQLHDLAGRLEEAWQTAGSVDLGLFLPPPGSPFRLPFLHELIKTELEIRYRRGQPLTLEGYLERFPELGPSRSLPAALIYEEYRVRQLYGDRPELATYRERFLKQFADLERLLREQPIATLFKTPTPSARAAFDPAEALPPPADQAGPGGAGGAAQVLPVSGGFTLLERIGSGQFGEVFRARAPGGIEVAVKRIFRSVDDEASRRELQALELIRSLRHPFLLQTHAFWQLEDRLVIVMELAEGSLSDWFKQCAQAGLPGIPAGELAAYVGEAAEALDYLHSQHVVHRDIKPANLLRVKGHAKVGDFGLARLAESRLATATFCGTPVYMAPEMWHSQVSEHSDQYSLALSYAEMRLGRRVYPGKDQFEIGQQHLSRTPDLEGLAEAEQRVLFKALAKDPDQRYPSCGAFARALAEALAPPPPPPPPPVPRFTRWTVVLALALLLSLGGLAKVGWELWQQPAPSPVTPAPAWLPRGFKAAEGARQDGRLYDRIVYPLEGARPLEFVLIPAVTAENVPACYMMRDKVSNEQFRAVMRDPRMHELLRRYAAKHPWTVKGRWEAEDLPPLAQALWVALATPASQGPLFGTGVVLADAARGQLPATDVTPTEAHCFAEYLGGRLPSGKEWDNAGGRYRGAAGPFQPGWKKGDGGIALDLEGPRPVGTSPADVSIYGCRDMAGNGFEWTRTWHDNPEEGTVPLADPKESDAVTVRGQSWSENRPYEFATARPKAETYNKAYSDVGFRVVIPVPADSP